MVELEFLLMLNEVKRSIGALKTKTPTGYRGRLTNQGRMERFKKTITVYIVIK